MAPLSVTFGDFLSRIPLEIGSYTACIIYDMFTRK